MSLNLTELKDEPLGLAPTSADFCAVPGNCFTELRDEPLGKHPIQAFGCVYICYVSGSCHADVETGQVMTAPDDVCSFTFDVDGLGDEALDTTPREAAPFPCAVCRAA